MHSSVPDEFKPAIFAQGPAPALRVFTDMYGGSHPGTGERLDFPAPSKKLRAPRRRPGHGGAPPTAVLFLSATVFELSFFEDHLCNPGSEQKPG